MSKIYFRFGTMDASKSLQALTTEFNYRKQGKRALLLIPAIADRDGHGIIHSRIGVFKSATVIYEDTNIIDELSIDFHSYRVDCLICDEAQFLSKEQVLQLVEIADSDKFGIPVIAYGLLKDYRGEFFEGSKYLTLYADSIEEIKTICSNEKCNKKAIMILKIKDGQPVYEGEQIEIGDAQYKSVCRKHYFETEWLYKPHKSGN